MSAGVPTTGRENAHMQRIAQIPGVGVLSATAAIATMDDPKSFKSGWEFCAWLGVVPRKTGQSIHQPNGHRGAMGSFEG